MLVAADVDPAGMMRFFETLQKNTGRAPTLPSYLSTHPSTEGGSSGSGRSVRRRALPPADCSPISTGATSAPSAARRAPSTMSHNISAHSRIPGRHAAPHVHAAAHYPRDS